MLLVPGPHFESHCPALELRNQFDWSGVGAGHCYLKVPGDPGRITTAFAGPLQWGLLQEHIIKVSTNIQLSVKYLLKSSCPQSQPYLIPIPCLHQREILTSFSDYSFPEAIFCTSLLCSWFWLGFRASVLGYSS